MSSPKDSCSILVNLAAEGMAPVIDGCTQALGVGSRPDGATGTVRGKPVKGITYFGPGIVRRWMAELGSQTESEQKEVIAQLATLSVADCRRQATEAVERLAGGASGPDKAVAVEYLTAIPLAVRRSLVTDRGTGRMTLPAHSEGEIGQTLMRVLPTEVPPFPIGSDLPGTSYRLEELLGIGGFGAVYKARNRFEQNQPPRAIKFCLDASLSITLHREQAILDRLMAVADATWSNRIVRLYGYALDVQPPFLVYEYVPGGDLTSHLMAIRQKTGRGLPPARALELIGQVAEALAFAHRQGLVHRDLKPANVLVNGATIKLTDFGIGGAAAAQAVRDHPLGGSATTHLSAAGQANLLRGSGTPLYMSPEQRRGDQPDPRHDLYSLGVMWYQVLVGDVTRELHPGWPDELIEEYQVPREHLELIQRCVGYFKKRPSNAGELLILLRSTPSARGPVSSPGEDAPAPQPEDGAGHRGDQDGAFDRLKQALVEQIDRDGLREARGTVAAMLGLRPDDSEVLAARDFILKRFSGTITEVHCFTEHRGWVRGVAFAPDSRRALSGGDDGTLRLWDLEGRRVLRCFRGHKGAVMDVAFAPDGRLALSGSWDGTVRLWDVASGRELRRFEGSWQAVKSVALSPDSRRGLFGGDDHVIHLIDLGSGREVRQFQGHTDLIQSLAFSPDGRRLISGSDDCSIRLWDVESGREHRRFLGHQDTVAGVACSPDGRQILSGSSDQTARLWDLASGRELYCFRGHANWVNSVAFAPDGGFALTGSGGEIIDGQFQDGADNTVRLWDLASGGEMCRFDGHLASVTSVAVAPGGKMALSGGLDNTVRVLQLPE